MAGYTKLFASIVHSTVWRAPDHVRLVWITMLAVADRRGHVEASVPGLADLARVSLDECVEALKQLAAPDEWSRTQEHEGRRIEEIPGGWHVLNHGLYRDRMAADVTRQQTAERVARFRERAAVRNGPVTPVTPRDAPKRQAEASAAPAPTATTEAEEQETPRGSRRARKPNGAPSGLDQVIAAYRGAYEHQHARVPVVTPADRSQVGRLLREPPPNIAPSRWTTVLVRLVGEYVRDTDEFLLRQAHPLRLFPGVVNKYLDAGDADSEASAEATT